MSQWKEYMTIIVIKVIINMMTTGVKIIPKTTTVRNIEVVMAMMIIAVGMITMDFFPVNVDGLCHPKY